MRKLLIIADIGKCRLAGRVGMRPDDVADDWACVGYRDLSQLRPPREEAAKPAFAKGVACRLVGKALGQARLEEDWVKLGQAALPAGKLRQAQDRDVAVATPIAERGQGNLRRSVQARVREATDACATGL
jgi:hypothetical protein